jgi:cytochrome c oxidase subunit II
MGVGRVTVLLASGGLDPQGPVARSVADLWWLMLALGTLVFGLVAGLLVVGLFRRPADDHDADRVPAGVGRWIIGGGVILPLVVVTVVFVATVASLRETTAPPPPGALVVDVIGHNWWWEVRYPDEGIRTANELHLPVGRPVALRITSADVIHSFWVPALAGKMDALPDGVNQLVLQADQPGTHRSQCAEFCGLQHAQMGLVVVAEPPAAYGEWVAQRRRPAAAPADGEARRGQEVFARSRCAECHAVAGTAATATTGPDLTHVASRPTLGAGAVANTPEDLARWVEDPHAIKEGVAMPAPGLPDEELDALLAYLAGLR